MPAAPRSPAQLLRRGSSPCQHHCVCQGNCSQVSKQDEEGAELGCIFHIPVLAFEHSRCKIDLAHDGRSPPRVDSGGMEQQSSRNRKEWAIRKQDSKCYTGGGNDSSNRRRRKPCRRRLSLDDTEVAAASWGEEESELLRSSSAKQQQQQQQQQQQHFLELELEGWNYEEYRPAAVTGWKTPMRDVMTSPIRSPPVPTPRSPSLRSMECFDSPPRLGNALKLQLMEDWTGGDITSLGEQLQQQQYSVYPGWSFSNVSCRNTSPERERSGRTLPAVKPLHQHLIQQAASRQPQPQQHQQEEHEVLPPPSSLESALIPSPSPRLQLQQQSRNVDPKAVGKSGEESKVPLLKSQRTLRKHSRKKSWEPVAFIARGLKSLATRGGYTFPSIPRNLSPRFDQLSIAEQLLSAKQIRKLLPKKPATSSAESSGPLLRHDGYVQCIFKQGVTSYSFWKDGFDEVLVAKVGESGTGDKHFTFYTCKRKEKSGWKQWHKSGVQRVGTMTLSSSIRTDMDSRGEIVHSMDSEFSLIDERSRKRQFPLVKHSSSSKSQQVKSIGLYFKTLLSNPRASIDVVENDINYGKELAAVVMRIPLKVKRESNSSVVDATTTAAASKSGKKPLDRLDRLLRTRQSEQRILTEAAWRNIVCSSSEAIHVILPTGEHGHPSGGLEGPRPLAERWRCGGLCDCGSWDLGCGMIVMSKDVAPRSQDDESLNLLVEGRKQNRLALSLAKCQDGLFRLSYQEPMISLSAFATAIAIVHTKFDATDSKHLWSHDCQTKLPTARGSLRRSRGKHLNPPLSPIHRL